MAKSIVRVALFASAALAGALTPAAANHSWGTYHWAGDGKTLALKINSAITPAWSQALTGAIADWEQSTELALSGPTPFADAKKSCDPIAGQILVCNDTYGQRGWLGIASIWLNNGHIVQGTTKLNDTYFNMARYNTPGWRALVACQEIGHDFGLDHQDETFGNYNLGTCMDYTSAPDGGVYNGFDYGPHNRSLNAHDYQQLRAIYDHNDGFTTASQTARGAAAREAGSGNGPAEWGRAIRVDKMGRPNVFEKTLAPGRKVVTHVFWAIGEGPRR